MTRSIVGDDALCPTLCRSRGVDFSPDVCAEGDGDRPGWFRGEACLSLETCEVGVGVTPGVCGDFALGDRARFRGERRRLFDDTDAVLGEKLKISEPLPDEKAKMSVLLLLSTVFNHARSSSSSSPALLPALRRLRSFLFFLATFLR